MHPGTPRRGFIKGTRIKMVRSRRLELPQGFPHKHLKLARLPFRHDRIVGAGV
jgi:hypothetical protein